MHPKFACDGSKVLVEIDCSRYMEVNDGAIVRIILKLGD